MHALLFPRPRPVTTRVVLRVDGWFGTAPTWCCPSRVLEQWNIVGSSKVVRHLTDRLGNGARWDLALLMECTDADVDVLRNSFPDADLVAFSDFGVDRTRGKPHGPVVIARNGFRVAGSDRRFPWSKDLLEPKGDKSSLPK